jgi:hypothetical protein
VPPVTLKATRGRVDIRAMAPIPHSTAAGLTRLQVGAEVPGRRELAIGEAQALTDWWDEVRNDMDDVLVACTKVASAGSGEDLRELLQDLEESVDRLACRRSRGHDLTRHNPSPDDQRRRGDDIEEASPRRSHPE